MKRTLALMAWLAAVAAIAAGAAGQEYQPLQVQRATQTFTFSLDDSQRERTLPLRAYVPQGPKLSDAHPVVLFSHGLGGSRDNNRYLGTHLAQRGYVALFLQHPGSDESVWKGQRIAKVMPALRKAASADNLRLRCGDVAVVVAQLKVWNEDQQHPLYGRLRPERVGVSGHSFGAHTVQAVLGQSFPLVGAAMKTPGVVAGIAYSPAAPARGDAAQTFRSIDKPLMLMTGTQDDSPIGKQTPESRLKVFPALPKSIARYELVLDGAKHMAFSDREGGRLGSGRRNPNHHRVILALSTAFWDAYLLELPEAKAWLHSSAPKKLMESKDRWQMADAAP